jgi:hypothetical protein
MATAMTAAMVMVDLAAKVMVETSDRSKTG